MPIYCKVTRGNHVESQHSIYAVAVNEVGEIIFSTGDPEYQTCIRSSLKPFQAAASVHAGAVKSSGFTDEELALMCASHNGEEIHVKTAKSMMNKLGFSKDHYECGIHAPYDKESKTALLHKKKDYSPFNNNCSGKHAGMLALAKHLEQGIKGYIQKEHAVQKEIFNLVHELTGLKNIPTETDGCSAPTPFLTLETIAQLFQKLAASNDQELSRVFDAMCANPILVGGTNRFDSLFIEALAGRGITKIGGESVRGISIKKPSGGSVGIALKVLDGNFRAMPIATMKLLEHLQLLSDDELKKLDKFRTKILKNHNQLEIGRIEAVVDA